MDPQLQPRIGRRLIFFPLPLQGHITPMLLLANILHSKGFSITILHLKLNSPNPANYPHFTFCPIDEDGGGGGGSSETSEASKGDIISILQGINAKCIEPFRQALGQLLADTSGDPVACLISDAILHSTAAVCRSLKLPRIVLRTGGVCSFLAFVAFPFLFQKGYLPLQEDRQEELVTELPPLRIKDLPAIKTANPEKLYELVEGMVHETKASSGLIWNSFEDLEASSLSKLHQQFQIPIFPIGPFHKHIPPSSTSLIAEDHTSISWLDKQEPNSVIYVSFGSIAAIGEDEFLEVAWGLANSRRPFLWVVRPGLIRGGADWLEVLPEGYVERLDGRGVIVKWAPQLEVLAHPSVGAFWTHCGWNSTLESICEGVPMICTPCFTDQLVNARYVSHVWNVGMHMENGLRRDEIEMTIERLMEEREGGVRERALHYKEKANLCVKPGGSSYDSLNKLVNYISFF